MTTNYTLTVSKFNNIVRDIFNNEELLHNIKIVGEVFGISTSKSSVYFSLKDEQSTLPCVCFYGGAMASVKEGDMVIATGSPNFYTKGGRFNFVVSKVEPFGLGLLFQKFQEMKEKLEKEGMFDQSHKKPIPQNIKRIGVVTSKDGAVIQDIKNVTWRRNKAIDIVLYDTKVQGNNAEKEICAGIEFFSDYDSVDVVIVARGGGSMEDLSAYNTEEVARATYACKKPIVSAVGHETDFTIIDFVSDLRAPTPSAAAELLTKDTKLSVGTLRKDISRLCRCLDIHVADKTMALSGNKQNFVSLAENYLSQRKIKLQRQVAKISNNLKDYALSKDHSLSLTLAHLNKLNPLDILALGYAKIEQSGKSISKLAELNLTEELEINFVDGGLVALPKNKK